MSIWEYGYLSWNTLICGELNRLNQSPVQKDDQNYIKQRRPGSYQCLYYYKWFTFIKTV